MFTFFANIAKAYKQRRGKKATDSFREFIESKKARLFISSLVGTVEYKVKTDDPTYRKYSQNKVYLRDDTLRTFIARHANDEEIKAFESIYASAFVDRRDPLNGWDNISYNSRQVITENFEEIVKRAYDRVYRSGAVNGISAAVWIKEWVTLNNLADQKEVKNDGPTFSPESKKVHDIAKSIYDKYKGYKLSFYRVNHLLLEIDKLPKHMQYNARSLLLLKVEEHFRKFADLRDDENNAVEVIQEAIKVL